MRTIHVPRKPCSEPTVAANVLRFGTGGLNVDGCRVSTTDALGGGVTSRTGPEQKGNEGWTNVARAEALGRWPANVLHDGSEGVVSTFPLSSGKGGETSGGTALGQGSGWNAHNNVTTFIDRRDDEGSASRFFQHVKIKG